MSRLACVAAVLIMIASTPASAGEGEGMSAATLLWDCEHLDERGGYAGLVCYTYVQGAVDMMTLTMAAFAPGTYCPPESGMTNDQISRIVTKWIKANPEEMHKNASIAVGSAMRRAFPCPKARKKP